MTGQQATWRAESRSPPSAARSTTFSPRSAGVTFCSGITHALMLMPAGHRQSLESGNTAALVAISCLRCSALGRDVYYGSRLPAGDLIVLNRQGLSAP